MHPEIVEERRANELAPQDIELRMHYCTDMSREVIDARFPEGYQRCIDYLVPRYPEIEGVRESNVIAMEQSSVRH